MEVERAFNEVSWNDGKKELVRGKEEKGEKRRERKCTSLSLRIV